MRFRFCGDLEAPTWLLHEVPTLSEISSVRLKLLAKQVLQQLLHGSLDYAKALRFTTPKGAAPDAAVARGAVAAVHFVVASAVKYDVDDAVFATDGSGVIAYANPAAAKRAHADATRLTGTSFPNLLDQDSRRRFVAALRESEGAPPSTSISLGGPLQLMKNGALEVTVECAAAPRPDAPEERFAVAAGRPARKRARA